MPKIKSKSIWYKRLKYLKCYQNVILEKKLTLFDLDANIVIIIIELYNCLSWCPNVLIITYKLKLVFY